MTCHWQQMQNHIPQLVLLCWGHSPIQFSLAHCSSVQWRDSRQYMPIGISYICIVHSEWWGSGKVMLRPRVGPYSKPFAAPWMLSTLNKEPHIWPWLSTRGTGFKGLIGCSKLWSPSALKKHPCGKGANDFPHPSFKSFASSENAIAPSAAVPQ